MTPKPSSDNRRGKYQVLGFAGKGSFGRVDIALKKATKEVYALKTVYFESEALVKTISREISILLLVKHPNIISYVESYDGPHSVVIVSEFCPGGSLAKVLQETDRFSVNLVGFVINQVLFGLDYLHRQHIVHRDIKPANILVGDRGYIKIGDFGLLLQDFNTVRARLLVGSFSYMAPELYDNTIYDKKIDIWLVGVTVHELLTGSVSEFPSRKDMDNFKSRLPGNSGKFVTFCLQPAAKRPNVLGLRGHRFLRKVDIESARYELLERSAYAQPSNVMVKKSIEPSHLQQLLSVAYHNYMWTDREQMAFQVLAGDLNHLETTCPGVIDAIFDCLNKMI